VSTVTPETLKLRSYARLGLEVRAACPRRPRSNASAIVDLCTAVGLRRQNDGGSGEMSDREQVREQTSGRLGDGTGLVERELRDALEVAGIEQVIHVYPTLHAAFRTLLLEPVR